MTDQMSVFSTGAEKFRIETLKLAKVEHTFNSDDALVFSHL